MKKKYLNLITRPYWFLLRFILTVATIIGLFGPANATDLMDIYKQALENDPTFKAAYSSFKSKAESIPQAYAALLPQLNLNAQGVKSSLFADVPGQDGLNGQQSYSSTIWVIKASQSIFNYQSWSRVQQAKASVRAAHAEFNNAAQELLLRTAKAYFDLLMAKDTLNFAEAKKRANKRQLEQAEQRFKVGIDTITSVYEAKAAYDQSVSEVISAENNQINQGENLRKLTNHTYDYVAPLRDGQIPLIKPEPSVVEEWIATGIKQNYKLFAAKYGLQAARENMKVQASGGWPTLSLQGNNTGINNYGNSSSNFFIPNQQKTTSIALALDFPVFQGGLVEANTKKAQYDYQTSSEDLEKTYREVVVNSHIAFNTIIDGISKVKADRQTIISRKNSLESTEAQYNAGTRTMVDVTNAQERLFEGQEQLAHDQYNLVNAILYLKYLAGSLNVNDFQEINAWLATKRINQFSPQS